MADLMERGRMACRRSADLNERSRALVEEARFLCPRRAARPAGPAGPAGRDLPVLDGALAAKRVSCFELEGTIGGQPVAARYEGGVLDCDPLLRSHADLVVAVGDTFSYGEGGPVVDASLEGPAVAVLVTLMRAMRVTSMRTLLG